MISSSLSFLLFFSLLCSISLSTQNKRTALIFRNGGNNTAQDWSVTVHPEDFSELWELANFGASRLEIIPEECSVFSQPRKDLKPECRKFWFDIFNTYGQQIFSLQEVADGDWLYLVPVTDHFVWPGHYVGRKLYLKEQSAEVGRDLFLETKSLVPRIFQILNWWTDEESAKIIDIAEEHLEPSYMVKKDRGTYYEEGRNSYQAWLPKRFHPFVVEADQRLGRFAHIPIELELEEQLQILRYYPNQHYFTHHDYFEREVFQECNRFLTILFYLSDVEEGGETAFPLGNDSPYEALTFNQDDCKRGIAIKPIKNSLVLFYNLLPESHMQGIVDKKTLHLGCDVVKGVKWAGNKWISNKACKK